MGRYGVCTIKQKPSTALAGPVSHEVGDNLRGGCRLEFQCRFETLREDSLGFRWAAGGEGGGDEGELFRA